MKLYLRINESLPYQLMVMDSKEDIALTFRHDNLDNPSNYNSEFSYNLKVPVCAENNKLFSNFIHLDSVIRAGGYDPTKYLEYVVLDNAGTLLSTGSAFIKSITGGYYNLSLTGSLSMVFTKALKSGWKDTDEEGYTKIEDPLSYAKKQTGGISYFVQETNVINKDIVYASWLIPNPIFNYGLLRFQNLQQQYGLNNQPRVTEALAFIASIIGFAPTAQGLLPDFNNDKWTTLGTIDGYASQSFAQLPVLCEDRDASLEPINPPDVGDGLLEAQMGEYRSYYQQPYIYIDKLWQIYQANFEAITGYKLILDGRWFSQSNPFLANLVYMLPKLYDEGNTEILESDNLADATGYWPIAHESHADDTQTFLVNGLSASKTLSTWQPIANVRSHKMRYNFTVRISIKNIPSGRDYYPSRYNFREVVVSVKDNNNLYAGYPVIMASKKYLLIGIPNDESYTMDDIMADPISHNHIVGSLEQGFKIVEYPFDPVNGGDLDIIEFSDYLDLINTRSFLNADTHQTSTQIYATTKYTSNNAPLMYYSGSQEMFASRSGMSIKLDITGVSCEITEANRTEKELSLKTLFREISPFSVLLQYAKLARLSFVMDDNEKTVTVVQNKDYFADCYNLGNGILDISELLDKTKGFDIRPLSWSESKVRINFENSNLDYISDYPEKYDNTYGSKVLVTSAKINTSEKKLLGNNENDKIAPSCMASETLVPIWNIINTNEPDFGYVENDPMILNSADGSSANAYGSFYFRLANSGWNVRLANGWRTYNRTPFVYITDDLDFETQSGEYAYRGPGSLIDLHSASWIRSTVRPNFSTTSRDGSISIHLAEPRERYCDGIRRPDAYLYEAKWKDYIEEVYDAQNKTVILYAAINKTTFDRIKSNPLVKIENCIYLVTEISGFGEHAATSKLTLRQIRDLSKLIGGPVTTAIEGDYILTEYEEEISTENGDSLIQE